MTKEFHSGGQVFTTSRLLSRIRASKSSAEVVKAVDSAAPVDFGSVLYDLMEKHQLKPKDLIRNTRIDRSYFYHLLSGKRTNPSRNIVLQMGICAGADMEEMNRLLKLAGCPVLYPRVRRDALLLHGLQKKMAIEEINTMLLEHEEIPLYREEKRDEY